MLCDGNGERECWAIAAMTGRLRFTRYEQQPTAIAHVVNFQLSTNCRYSDPKVQNIFYFHQPSTATRRHT